MCVMTIEGWQIVSDVIGHIAWPLVVVAALLVLRRPIIAFISDIDEAGWGSAKVKRGNKRSETLKAEATDGTQADDAFDSEPTADDAIDTGSSDAKVDPSIDPAHLLRYYGRIVIDRLRGSKYNVDTTSARLGAEIVGSTYADLKQAVRVVAYVHGSVGMRGKLPSLETSLDALQLPSDLDGDIREARKFSMDVTSRTVKVNGEGAANYIDSVRAVTTRLLTWAIDKAASAPAIPIEPPAKSTTPRKTPAKKTDS
jgi:hypothetical protein